MFVRLSITVNENFVVVALTLCPLILYKVKFGTDVFILFGCSLVLFSE